MEVTTEKVGPCEFVMSVSVEPERLAKPLRQAARRLGKRRPLPGFRPGKAPYEIAERAFGKAAIYDQMLNDKGDELYQEALAEAQLEAFAPARFEIEQLEPLVLHITVPTQPQVTLGDYGQIKVKLAKPRVSKKEVTQVLDKMREDSALWVPVERPTAMGDQIVIDAQGKADDGHEIEQNDLTLELTEALMPTQFRENLLGIAPEESKEFDFQYPDDFRDADLAGKSFQFHVLVKSVKTRELPALDDALAQTLGEYETLKDLREDVQQKLRERKQSEAKDAAIEQALSALVDQATLEYPAIAVEGETNSMIRSIANRLSEQGFTLEGYLNTTSRTLQGFRDETRPQAEGRLKRSIVLGKFAEAEDIKLEKADVDREVDQITESLGEEAESVREALTQEVVLQSISGGLYNRKVLERLLSIATGQAQPRTADPVEASESETPDGASDDASESAST